MIQLRGMGEEGKGEGARQLKINVTDGKEIASIKAINIFNLIIHYN